MPAPTLAPTPTGEASWLLPARAYWDDGWFADERRLLFARTWVLAGTVEDVAAGTCAATVAGQHVRVVDGPLGLQAEVVAGGPRRPVAAASWSCFVFVHLDPEEAEPLETWLHGFGDRIGGFQPDRLVEVARHRFHLACNWKLFVENHVDVYHLWYLHQESLGAYEHVRARWGEAGRHWVFYEPPRAGVPLGEEPYLRGLLPVGHVDADAWGSGAHLLFPATPLATGAGFFMTYQCQPTGPEGTTIDVRLRAEPGSVADGSLGLSLRILEEEDGSACEAMQRALRSPWFSVGPLARTHELPITRFHQHVLDALGVAVGEPGSEVGGRP